MKLTDLQAGMDIWHNETPYRLIRRVWLAGTCAKFVVQPLYVDKPERTLVICKTDAFHLAQFHSKTA